MGQTHSSTVSSHDLQLNGNYEFFQQLDLASAHKIICKWEDGKPDVSRRLTWKEYFSVLLAAQEELASDRDKYSQKHWSPVCHGYAMSKKHIDTDDQDDDQHSASEHDNLDDSHTDDDESETYSEDNNDVMDIPNNEAEQTMSIPERHSKNQQIHPIFIGYSTEYLHERDVRLQSERNKFLEREERAMERAITARSSALNQMEEQFRMQNQNREKKIEQIKTDYQKEQMKRKADFEKNMKDLDLTLATPLKVS
jgi:hypothetical protein